MKRKYLSHRIPYPLKIFFKMNDKIKVISDKNTAFP